MDAEAYVNGIVRKVKCTGAKKKEIRNQLLSDIAVRKEQGESLEQIMESMGSVKEIAEAFCQELPDADKKAYRRKRMGVILGAVVVILTLLAIYVWWILPKRTDSDAPISEGDITAKTEEVVDLLDADDFDTLRQISIPEMQAVLNLEKIDEARLFVSDNWGEMQSMGTVYTEEMEQKGEHFTVAQVAVSYEHVNVFYTFIFDETGKLAGIYMR